MLVEFDREVAEWIQTNWMHINEYTHKLCKGKKSIYDNVITFIM